jgi:hypothetical protein
MARSSRALDRARRLQSAAFPWVLDLNSTLWKFTRVQAVGRQTACRFGDRLVGPSTGTQTRVTMAPRPIENDSMLFEMSAYAFSQSSLESGMSSRGNRWENPQAEFFL